MTIDYSDKTGQKTNTAAENREAQNTADLSSASFSGPDLQQYRYDAVLANGDHTVLASGGVVIRNTVPEKAVSEDPSGALSGNSVPTTVIYRRDGSMTLQPGSEPEHLGNTEGDRVVGEASPGPSGPHSYSGPLGIECDNLAGRDAGRSEEFTITVRKHGEFASPSVH